MPDQPDYPFQKFTQAFDNLMTEIGIPIEQAITNLIESGLLIAKPTPDPIKLKWKHRKQLKDGSKIIDPKN
jgi:hypothetical protein